MQYKPEKMDNIKGLFISISVVLLWFGSLVYLLTIVQFDWIKAIPFIAIQTFLFTGLFITAHDSMHGVVFPENKKINNFIGSLALILYALFSFKKLKKKHWEHHDHPASEDDPDFHDGEHDSFWAWYFHFLISYVSFWQILGMAIIFNILAHVVEISQLNLMLFWLIPNLLSTLQLFYFGTYLPHREEESEPFADKNRSRSNNYGTFLSFITCYHFGYHWEHHKYPWVAWWKLPSVRKEMFKDYK